MRSLPTLCTTRPAVVFAAVCLLLPFLKLTVVSEEEREGRWMHKKTAQGQVIHGTNPEAPVGTMVTTTSSSHGILSVMHLSPAKLDFVPAKCATRPQSLPTLVYVEFLSCRS
jgi:hypothetical protein